MISLICILITFVDYFYPGNDFLPRSIFGSFEISKINTEILTLFISKKHFEGFTTYASFSILIPVMEKEADNPEI